MLRAGVAAPKSMKKSIMPSRTWLATFGLLGWPAPGTAGARCSRVMGLLVCARPAKDWAVCAARAESSALSVTPKEAAS